MNGKWHKDRRQAADLIGNAKQNGEAQVVIM